MAENVLNLISILPFTQAIIVFYNFRLIKQDEDDNKYVDCAIASNAICLVSNDRHFQELKKVPFPEIQLVTLSEFSEKYKEKLLKS